MKKVLAWAVALALVLSSFTMAFAADAPNSSQFKDADQIQYTEAVDVMVATGIINGFPDGTFGPQKTVQRDQMAKMIACIMNGGEDVGEQYKSACPFADSQSSWAAGYIAYCASEHIIDGRSADVFDPTATVTGTEVAKMALTSLGYDSGIQGYTGETWAANVLKDAKKNKLFEGLDKSFVPGDPCSREAAAQILFNMLKAVEVEYATNTSVSVGDATVAVNSKAEKVKSEEAGIEDDNGDTFVNLYEDVFGGKLSITEEDADEYGSPAHSWTFDGDDVGTYVDTADYEFVAEDAGFDAAVKAYDEDLAEEIADYNGTFVLNGDEATAAAVAIGDTVKLFVDEDSYEAVIVQYKAYQIEDVDTDVKKKDADKGVTAYVSFAGLGEYKDTEVANYDASTYVKDAVIAVAANADGEILDSYVMEELATGEIEKINSKTGAVTIDGTAYDKATNYEALDDVEFVDPETNKLVEGEFTLYDYNGYYLASLQTVEPESEVLYGAVVNFGQAIPSEWWGGDQELIEKVKIYTTEGKTETYTIAEDCEYADVDLDDPTEASRYLIAYTLNDDGEVASITPATLNWKSTDNDKITMGTNGVIEGKAVSEDIVVFFDNADHSGQEFVEPDYTTYGFSDLEAADSISAYYFMSKDGEVVVAMLTDPIEATETILGFVTDVDSDVVTDGTQATVSALVDGKEVTPAYKTVVGTAGTDYKIADEPFDTLMVFVLNGDNELTEVKKANIGNAPVDKIQTSITGDAVYMDVTVDGTKNNSLDILAGDDYNYQSVDGADIYYVNEDGDLVASSYSKIKKGATARLYQTDANSKSWNIVVFRDANTNSNVEYTITTEVTPEGNGTVSVPASSTKGETVTITVEPAVKTPATDEAEAVYYGIESVTCAESDGTSVTVTPGENNTYTFEMPEGNVTVTVEFEPEA